MVIDYDGDGEIDGVLSAQWTLSSKIVRKASLKPTLSFDFQNVDVVNVCYGYC